MRAKDLIYENKKNTPEVYLDMDGVLADFFAEYAVLAGLPRGSSYRDIPPAKADPTLNKMIGTDFFARLPKFSTADALVSMVVKLFGHYHICSSPLRGDFEGSAKYKKIWIAEHLNPQPREILITPNKAKYAVQADGTPNILIDDRGSNITAWEAAGGVGIKYQADENGLDVVMAGFKRAIKIVRGRMEHEPQQLTSKDRSSGKLIAKSGDEEEQDVSNMDKSYNEARTTMRANELNKVKEGWGADSANARHAEQQADWDRMAAKYQDDAKMTARLKHLRSWKADYAEKAALAGEYVVRGVAHKFPSDVKESVLRDKEDYTAKLKVLLDLERNKDVDPKAVQQRKLDLEREAKAKGIKEAIDQAEYTDEADMVQTNLRTIIRVAEELSSVLDDNEDMAEWAQEKIAIVKSMIVTVTDYVISQHEQGNVQYTSEEYTPVPQHNHQEYSRKQQAEFKVQAEKVRSIMSKHKASLSPDEIKLLTGYYAFITNKESRITKSDVANAEQLIANFERFTGLDEEIELDEKTDPKLCRSTKRLGRSDYSSCVSQGLRAHSSKGKGHTDGHGNYLKGKKAKSTQYGGDVPDYS